MDLAQGRGAMEIEKLEAFLDDIRLQPQWRREADKCCDYYDNHQLDSDVLQRMARLGIPPLVSNLIAPTVDLVLGMEAKTRSNPRVKPDDDEWQDVSEAMSKKLLELQRESRADKAVSDAYASQIKAGLGWVYVGRSFDPFKYRYVVEYVPRNEIWWDWHDLSGPLDDARYLVRRKWYDVDLLINVFKRHKKLLEHLVGRLDKPNWDLELIRDMGLAQNLNSMMATRIDQSEWLDTERKRLGLYEVWYRVWKEGHVVELPNGRVVEVNVKNPRHAAAVLSGKMEPIPAVFSRVRLSWWIGPYRLDDIETKQNHFPYVPFWGKREDRSAAPYGLVRAMLSPQDEVNARSAKMMWLLSSKRVLASKQAVANPDAARKEVARADAWIELSENFDASKHVFKVEQDLPLSQQQFEIMQERKQALQEAAGVYQPMLGNPAGTKSGIAIASLVEQGVTTLAEINDNYRFARQLVFDYGLELIVEDMAKKENVAIKIDEPGKKKKTVMLNVPAHDELGEYRDNDVERAMMKVGLEDVPATPAYRAQMFMMLGEMSKGMPPALQAFIVPFLMRASDLPQRHEIADAISRAIGVSEDGQPQDPQAMQLQQDNAALQDLVGKLQAALAEQEQALKSKEGELEVKHRQLDQKDEEMAMRRAEQEQRMALDGEAAMREADAAEREDLAQTVDLVERVTGYADGGSVQADKPAKSGSKKQASAAQPSPDVEALRGEVNAKLDRLTQLLTSKEQQQDGGALKAQIAELRMAMQQASRDKDGISQQMAGQLDELKQTLMALLSRPANQTTELVLPPDFGAKFSELVDALQRGPEKKSGVARKMPDGSYQLEVSQQ